MRHEKAESLGQALAKVRACPRERRRELGRELARIAAVVRRYCRARASGQFRGAALDEIAESVEHKVVASLLRGDLPALETKFFGVVRRLLLNAKRSARRRALRFVPEVEEQAREESDDDPPAQRSPAPAVVEPASSRDELEQIQRIALGESLNVLSGDELHAFVLHCILDVEIASINPRARTVSMMLARSERTTRRLLRRAERILRENAESAGKPRSRRAWPVRPRSRT